MVRINAADILAFQGLQNWNSQIYLSEYRSIHLTIYQSIHPSMSLLPPLLHMNYSISPHIRIHTIVLRYLAILSRPTRHSYGFHHCHCRFFCLLKLQHKSSRALQRYPQDWWLPNRNWHIHIHRHIYIFGGYTTSNIYYIYMCVCTCVCMYVCMCVNNIKTYHHISSSKVQLLQLGAPTGRTNRQSTNFSWDARDSRDPSV